MSSNGGKYEQETYKRNREKNSRIRILLSETEYSDISSATFTCTASKSLLVLEAIQDGLRNLGRIQSGTRRTRRLDVRVPRECRTAIKQIAKTRGLSQQSLLRLMLHNYLTAAPWNIGEMIAQN